MPFTFLNPAGAICAALLLVGMFVIVWRRTPAVPRMTLLAGAVGCAFIALAAGGLAVMRPTPRPIVVMVDLSPSTRAAGFRDRDTLRRRIAELIGDAPHEVTFFAEQARQIDESVTTLPDLPATRTAMPDAGETAAVVLFSDGRLMAPRILPPVFAVVDPSLDPASDAAVTSLDVRSDVASISMRNTGTAARAMSLKGIEGEGTVAVNPGAFTLTRRLAPGAFEVSATFAPGDVWPENDALRASAPPRTDAERWRVGTTNAAAKWRIVSANELPADSARYLATSVVVLDNVAADALTAAQQSALDHYVRDVGGGLVILGGARAFAAGAYAGTTLDALSPLASTPPEPTTHWLLLADASGSMNQDVDGKRTRWQFAADAIISAAKQLPPADVLSIGSFAADVRWWLDGQPVSGMLSRRLPPDDVRPGGPTNLEGALNHVAAMRDANLPKQLLLATDGQAAIDGAEGLATQLKSRNIHVHVLLIGDVARANGLPALRSIVDATGGTLRIENDPANWAKRLQEAVRAAQPNEVRRNAVTVRFLGPLTSLPPVEVNLWSPTWPHPQTTPLADAELAGQRLTMAARWNIGEGRVAAVAFAPTEQVVEAVAKLVERPPRDPRFKVSWDANSTVRVTVDAVDGKSYLNGERFVLETSEHGGTWSSQPLQQTAPGRYEASIAAPPRGAIARVRYDGAMLDAIAVPERYPAEFDAIGNDRAALTDLARRTGGVVIEPGVTRKLDIPAPRRVVPAVSFLALAGAIFVLAGLIRWRIGS